MTILTPYRFYTDIDLNFPVHPQNGDVGKVIDVNAVKQSFITLVLTRFGERPFQPDLGSPIYALLFEQVDPITTESIKASIEQIASNHEPRIQIESLSVNPDYQLNGYDVTVYFTVVGIPLPINFSFSLKRLR